MTTNVRLSLEQDRPSPWRAVGTVVRVGVPTVVLLTLVGSVIWFFTGPEEPAPNQIARLRDGVGDLFLFAAAMGVVGMAFVEMGKRMLLLRGAYHAHRIREIFGPHVHAALLDPLRVVGAGVLAP